MSVSIIVGGQYGSEGKGKIAYWLGMTRGCDYAVRVGGPNSGHTIIEEGEEKKYQMLSSARNSNDTTVYVFPSGSYINIEILLNEIKERNLSKNRIAIDPYAWIIDSDNIEVETKTLNIVESIGSTGSGTGACLIERISRSKENKRKFAKDFPELNDFIKDTKTLLGEAVDEDKDIILEGTQGYGLSLLHSEEWPYVTSRDTTAAGILSEVGLSPLDVDDIILVIRTYPIRVGGNSGPMKNEITWDTITERSGSSEKICEYTTVTNRLRRVAEFDPEIVRKAIMANNPTIIVLNHADYYDISTQGKEELSDKQVEKISDIENSLDVRIDFIGNGPDTIIDYEEMLGATTLNILGFMK